LFPWLTLLSGLFVVGIGLNLMVSRFRSFDSATWLRNFKTALTKSKQLTSPVLQYDHAEAAGHQHKFILGSSQGHFHSHEHTYPHGYDHHHDHGDHHGHEHAPADHSHLPPGAGGEPVTWRSLLALGISGGLIPCPSALVVLLGAIALNRIGFGLILVLAFSLGLAGALTAIGMLFIYAGKLFNRFPSQGRILRFLPVLSALFVSVIGVGIAIKALKEMGVI
jgi:ABC-type nickel/cobalt efflux system permease component RcnA